MIHFRWKTNRARAMSAYAAVTGTRVRTGVPDRRPTTYTEMSTGRAPADLLRKAHAQNVA